MFNELLMQIPFAIYLFFLIQVSCLKHRFTPHDCTLSMSSRDSLESPSNLICGHVCIPLRRLSAAEANQVLMVVL